MNILLEGVDAPSASAILLARPTRSQTLMTQIVGRGLRIHPNKEDCLVIDLTTGETKVMTDGQMDAAKPPEQYCQGCGQHYHAHFTECPYCGYRSLSEYYDTNFNVEPQPKAVVPYREMDQIVSLFEELRGSWYRDQENDYIAVDLGYGRGTLVIIDTPPELVACVSETFDLGRYSLMHVREGDVQLMWSSMDIEILMIEADYMAFGPNGIAQRGMHTGAHWRSEMASLKQVGYLRRLGVPEELLMDIDKGKASQLISYYKSRRDLERFLATGHISVRQSQPFMIQQSLF